ncbi:FxsA family protein [Mycobacterium sp. Marseille-P9652]|uniref:FxsA family protein n=1 Tax=Mycobacterium sp. Marseille-P9652 TaxID=2654950 RepID=UPI0012E95BDA|nr:FxsA family protein [Mycobacterium sp. Marseille-P9652]
MMWRLFLVYAVVELAAVIALVSTVGWGWTLLVLLATSLLGWGVLAPMAGSHLVHRIGQLRSGLNERRALVSDGAMVTLAMGLVMVPGLVTTVLGLLLLWPPLRVIAAPVAARGLRRRIPLLGYATAYRAPRVRAYQGGGDYIDGEVIDVHDVDAPALPNGRAGGV